MLEPRSTIASLSDLALVEAVKAGKPGASAELWDRCSPVVRRVIRRAITTDDVEDLVQEVFLRVFRKISTLRDAAALRAFVLSITSSVIVSDMRRRKVRKFLWLTRTGELPERASALPDDESREALDRLYKILDRSSHEERMSFVLKHVEGMELEEVSRVLGISLATVKRRLVKVNERLTRAVGDHPGLAAALGLVAMGEVSAVQAGKR